MTNTQYPAGWYPQEDGRLRYWDGLRWTENVAPAQPSSRVGPSTVQVAGDEAATVPQRETPAKTARRWFVKKRILIPSGLLSFLIIVAIAGGGGTPSPQKATPVAGAASTTQSVGSPSAAPTPDAAQAAAEAKAKAEADAEAKAKADTKAKAEAEVNAKAKAAEAASAAALKDPNSYPRISARDYALVVKDPAAHQGQKAVVYAYVSQFDSATGNDNFRASTGGVQKADWYEYDVNTLVTATDPDLLANVVQGDLVTMYVEVMGSFSYDTQIGGSTTVPQLQVNIIKVTGSSD